VLTGVRELSEVSRLFCWSSQFILLSAGILYHAHV
jgi:hypothetical protein